MQSLAKLQREQAELKAMVHNLTLDLERARRDLGGRIDDVDARFDE
ncbi:MAG: hypothetical protein K9K38_06610 [Rhodoferax sp.]|nr:hypothetical protein [Rhodoferax sp.]